METPAQTVARLLVALEDLTAQETRLLRAGNYPAVLQTQGRISPLVERLIALGPNAGNEIRGRIAAVIGERQRSTEWLGAALEFRRDELQQTRADQRRLAQIGPAYRVGGSGARQLRALG